ncbi:MAG: hypothetical protein JNM39_04770 [Bdellovibrionaceae bacterium]|nr:hypothetical protein [Pseudobdellovibrionaceae bacterium]
MKVKFEHSIPNEVRPRLAQIAQEVFASLPETSKDQMTIEAITFRRSNRSDLNWGDSADPIKNSINLSLESFRLSEISFKALVVHELTHLIVFRSFRMKNGISLLDYLKSKGLDHEGAIMAVRSHAPMAELLCDLLGVIVTKDPKAYSTLVREFLVYWPLEVSQKFRSESLESLTSGRDFSIQLTAEKWIKSNHQIKTTHDYLNQTRSYLWERWLSTLPSAKHPLVFERVLQTFGDLFMSPNNFDTLISNADGNVSIVNQRIIEILNTALEKAFHHDLL